MTTRPGLFRFLDYLHIQAAVKRQARLRYLMISLCFWLISVLLSVSILVLQGLNDVGWQVHRRHRGIVREVSNLLKWGWFGFTFDSIIYYLSDLKPGCAASLTLGALIVKPSYSYVLSWLNTRENLDIIQQMSPRVLRDICSDRDWQTIWWKLSQVIWVI